MYGIILLYYLWYVWNYTHLVVSVALPVMCHVVLVLCLYCLLHLNSFALFYFILVVVVYIY